MSLHLHVVSLQVYELMRRCWEQTPDRRITFKCLIKELSTMQQQLIGHNDLNPSLA